MTRTHRILSVDQSYQCATALSLRLLCPNFVQAGAVFVVEAGVAAFGGVGFAGDEDGFLAPRLLQRRAVGDDEVRQLPRGQRAELVVRLNDLRRIECDRLERLGFG